MCSEISSSTLAGIDSADLSTASNASAAISAIDGAIEINSSARADLGATRNRLESHIASLRQANESLTGAESRIRDADLAEETAGLVRTALLTRGAASVAAQANVSGSAALRLLSDL